ncbi:MAG TPA: phage holin family protein, partial [Thermoleophilaceae bacterium]|jgi:protein-S-isoprenylcysteine O-methyltransferase Ste14|nr:phage holin family protein [Thermoleophilaceae bacterium]
MADDKADKQLGEIVGEVTSKASLLVKEEIELAKAEISQKAKRLGVGAGLGAVAGAFLFFFLIFFLHMLALGFSDWFSLKPWVGYALVCVLLLVFAGLLGFVALRMFKKGSSPVPTMAIDEAKKTRAAIEEARR